MPFNCSAKVRYRQADQACTVSKVRDGYEVKVCHTAAGHNTRAIARPLRRRRPALEAG
jgi:hypothetical protein